MNTNERKTVTVDLFFPTAMVPMPSGDPSLSIRLVRGRLTAFGSWLRLDLRGTSQAIEASLRLNRTGHVAA